MRGMNKAEILAAIVASLTDDLEAITRGARESAAAASDPDSKAENKYDTRTLEASYVARGQAQRVAELREAVQIFSGLSGQDFPPGAAIVSGALVALKSAPGEELYLIGPVAGGTAVMWEGKEVLVITPQSPIGQKLLGKKAGDAVLLRPGASASIAAVW